MRWLFAVGLLLIVIGLGGSIGACYQTSQDQAQQTSGAATGLDGGVPAQQADPDPGAPLILAPLSGLALALGLGLVGIGIGRWRRPLPSYTRPANPWSDQPAEKADPPVGLV
jgi:hypothetical protein